MDSLLAPIEGADHHEVGSVTVDVVRAATGLGVGCEAVVLTGHGSVKAAVASVADRSS